MADWQDDQGYKRAEAFIESHDSGIYVPVDTGVGVHYPHGSNGAGPIGDAYIERGRDKRGHIRRMRTARTSNAHLVDTVSGGVADLWIDQFQPDFGITGMDAQSKYKADFYPRFLTAPRFSIRTQCFNQEQYNRIVKFIRTGMIRHLATDITGKSLFELRIDDRRALNKYRRTTKGGYTGWALTGYIESVEAGAERFVNSPTLEFTFVLVNALDGIVKSLDGLEKRRQLSRMVKSVGSFLGQFNASTPNPDLDLPDAFEEKKEKKKANKKPESDPPQEPSPPPALELGELAGTVWSWLTG